MKNGCSKMDASCQEASMPKVPTSDYMAGYLAGQKGLAERLEFVINGLWKCFKTFEARKLMAMLLVEFVNPYLE